MKSLRRHPVAPSVRALAFAAALCCATATAPGQQVQVRMQRAPHYAGEPVLVRFEVRGFDDQPEAVPAAAPAGASIRFGDIGTSRSSSTIWLNGRARTQHRNTYNFDYYMTANEPGTLLIGPFTFRAGNRKITSDPFEMSFQAIDIDSDTRVALIFPSAPVYPGQRVPVKIEWMYPRDFDTSTLQSLVVRSPLFDRFRFEDVRAKRGDTQLPITVGTETIALKATVSNRVLDGRRFIVLSAERQMWVGSIKPGEQFGISAVTEKVTSWQHGVFGRRPRATARFRAVGASQTLQVRPIPLDDAPSAFAGTIGRGVSMLVTADRTVVRVGDPITLRVMVRGDGNLDSAVLAPLDRMGLDPAQFRLPTADIAGTYEAKEQGGVKTFEFTVRVIDEAVKAIPPLTFAWFGPETQKFATVQSSPIALNVLATQMVTAADVVGQPAGPGGPGADADRAETPAPDVAAKRSAFDLTSADLAIEVRPALLLVDPMRGLGGPGLITAIYAGSVLAVPLAWRRRRARDADPKVLERRRVIRAEVQTIVRAKGQSGQASARAVAGALRRIGAEAGAVDGAQRDEIDRVLADIDVHAFARGGDDDPAIDAALYDRALGVARRIASAHL